MINIKRLAGLTCSNCGRVFPTDDIREMLYKLRAKVGVSDSWQPRMSTRLSYAPPHERRLICATCLMEHTVTKRRLILIELTFWLVGLALCFLIAVTMMQLAPARPPTMDLSDLARHLEAGGSTEVIFQNRNSSSEWVNAVIGLSLAFIPIAILSLWGLRKGVFLFVKPVPVRPEHTPTNWSSKS